MTIGLRVCPISGDGFMGRPTLSFDGGGVRVIWGGLTARIDGDRIQLGHLGCKLFGTIAADAKRAGGPPPTVFGAWDEKYRGWKGTGKSVERLGEALSSTSRVAEASGLVLWDTMRKGSDYWRPGNLLTAAADYARRLRPDLDVSYAREDDLCPTADLLERAKREGLPFGDFAQEYAGHLGSGGRIERAAAAVVMAAAQGRLAVFYCTDPFVPGYGDARALAGGSPYRSRRWLAELPEAGCHRVVLAGELIRYFLANGLPARLFEIDQTFGVCHVRAYTPGGPLGAGTTPDPGGNSPGGEAEGTAGRRRSPPEKPRPRRRPGADRPAPRREVIDKASGFTVHELEDHNRFLMGELPASLRLGADQFEAIWALHPDEYHAITIHGRPVRTPRWQQAYGRDYHYTGRVNRALPVPPSLEPLLAWSREAIDNRLNGLLLNWYDGQLGHYIGPHRDSIKGLVPGAPIVTISFGERRTFRLRHPGLGVRRDFPACDGAVFVTPWDTNLAWTHEVPKSAKSKGRRVSVTIRTFEAG